MDVVGLVAGSGWAAGLNLYAVTLVLGLAGRFGWADVPQVLTRTDVMVAAGVLFAIEFLADKVPYLDSAWDVIHTVIRPLGAAALGFVIAGESASMGQALGALVAGSLAATSHSGKASIRAAVNTSPEPVSNIAVSVLEDGVVGGVMALAIAMPLVAVGVVSILAVMSIIVTVLLWRGARRLFLSVFPPRKDQRIIDPVA